MPETEPAIETIPPLTSLTEEEAMLRDTVRQFAQQEIAPRVRDICRRYGLPYNTGPLGKQLGTVHRTILRLAFPGGKVRPKPGPYRPERV